MRSILNSLAIRFIEQGFLSRAQLHKIFSEGASIHLEFFLIFPTEEFNFHKVYY